MAEPFKALVSTDWLAANLDAEDVKPLDASWRLPSAQKAAAGAQTTVDARPAREDWLERRIPGAAFFDLDEISDKTSPLPHMAPSPDAFARAAGALGIAREDRVIVYDDDGIFSAPRVWWTFRLMGHDRVAVLDGGLPKWRRENRPLEGGAPETTPRQYTIAGQANTAARTADAGRVLRALDDARIAILDARAAARFEGRAPEPRAGLRSGAMPGAINLPYADLLAADGTMKPAADLAALFDRLGVDAGRPAIASCGSGVTAAIIVLALELAGRRDVALYDGSWAEWGASDAADRFPVV